MSLLAAQPHGVLHHVNGVQRPLSAMPQIQHFTSVIRHLEDGLDCNADFGLVHHSSAGRKQDGSDRRSGDEAVLMCGRTFSIDC